MNGFPYGGGWVSSVFVNTFYCSFRRSPSSHKKFIGLMFVNICILVPPYINLSALFCTILNFFFVDLLAHINNLCPSVRTGSMYDLYDVVSVFFEGPHLVPGSRFIVFNRFSALSILSITCRLNVSLWSNMISFLFHFRSVEINVCFWNIVPQ